MELKAPAPLGEGQTDVPSNDNVLNKPHNNNIQETKSLKFVLPSIKLPNIKLPQIHIPKENRSKIINISLILVPTLLLLLLFILISSFVRSEPYRMADDFLESIRIRDVSGAYSMTTDAYQVVVSKKEFEKVITQLTSVDISNPKVESRKIEEVPGMGKYAYIKYKISGYFVDIIVFNDKTNWGIHSIEISVIENN